MEWYNIVLAVITIIIGCLIAKYLNKYLRKMLTSRTAKELFKKLGYNEAVIDYGLYFLKTFIYIITFIITAGILGFAQQILLLIAIILIFSVIGILVYSLRDFIPNAFAGAYIKNNRIIRKGEKISIKDFKGKVKKIDLLTTIIEDEKGKVVIIPNNLITKYVLRK